MGNEMNPNVNPMLQTQLNPMYTNDMTMGFLQNPNTGSNFSFGQNNPQNDGFVGFNNQPIDPNGNNMSNMGGGQMPIGQNYYNNFGQNEMNPNVMTAKFNSLGPNIDNHNNYNQGNTFNVQPQQMGDNNMDLSISYKNHDVDEDSKRRHKLEYGRVLQEQINQKNCIYILT